MSDYSTYRPDKWEIITGTVIVAISLAVIGILFYDTPLPAVLTVVFMRPALKVYSSIMAGKRRDRLKWEFRDLLDSLAASFAGGCHMNEALYAAQKELAAIYDEDDDIMLEINNMLKRMDDGETDSDVLEDFAGRTGIEDIQLFAQVFRTCKETGGDIVTAMTDSSSMLGDKIKIENGIKALTSQKKAEGAVISVMPVIIIVFLRMIAPDYIGVLYGDPIGIMLMTASLAATCFAFYMIRKITDIEV